MRPRASSAEALARRLARALQANGIDWKHVATLLERIEGPLASSARHSLLRALREGRRNDAMVAFEALRDGTFVADLLALLDDADAPPAASRAVLKALARMPGADADEVARALGQRLVAGTGPTEGLLRAIARRGGAEAARVLVGYVDRAEHPDEIPIHLLKALAVRDGPAVRTVLLDALRRVRSPAAQRVLLDIVSVPGATAFTQTLIDVEERRVAAGGVPAGTRGGNLGRLGWIGGERAVTYLLDVAGRRGARRTAAIQGLGYVRHADARTRDRLLQALRQAGRDVGGAALERSLVQALGALRHEPAIPLIAQRLEHGPLALRRTCVRALGRFGAAARGTIGALSRVAAERDPSLRMSLATALGRIGGPHAQRAMDTMAADREVPARVRDVLRRSRGPLSLRLRDDRRAGR